MAMQQCPNGHLYDDEKNSSCPYCGGNNTIDKTVPLGGTGGSRGGFPHTGPIDTNQFTAPIPPVAGSIPNTTPIQQDIPKTQPVQPSFQKTTYKSDMINDEGIVEVRGWLVCLKGAKRGVDYKIYGERNTIGRGSENDIRLDFDSKISKEANAIIAYDNRNNKFYLTQENSKNNIYYNDQILLVPVELKDYDIIEIGETKLLFRSLCNENFTWESTKEEK